jgi:CheY-like chemotaxis protein
MKIVYIDDDIDDCEFVEEAARSLDESIECITFKDSPQGLSYLSTTEELPDYILLDINMPKLDGRECLIKIKENPRLQNITIVMCSTSFSTREMKIYFELGANDFIVKPTSLEKLKEALYSILHSEHSGKAD